MPILSNRNVNLGDVARGRALHRGSCRVFGTTCSNNLDQTSRAEIKCGGPYIVKLETAVVAGVRRSEGPAMCVLGKDQHRLVMKTSAPVVLVHQPKTKLLHVKYYRDTENDPNDYRHAMRTTGDKDTVDLTNLSRHRPRKDKARTATCTRDQEASNDDNKENIDPITGEEVGIYSANRKKMAANKNSILADKLMFYA
ncbi:hypothetical protein RUND412_007119 [Rhizina undulata]